MCAYFNIMFLKSLDKFLSYFEDNLILFSGISIFIVMILTSFQILSRVMGYPWPGYLEISELTISIFAFLGVAYAQKMDSHIRMELLVANLKGRIKWLVELISSIVSLLIVIILIYYSLLFAIDAYKIGDSTYDYLYPTWPAKILVPTGFFFWALRLLIEIIGYSRMLIFKNESPFGIPIIKSPEELAKDEISSIRD